MSSLGNDLNYRELFGSFVDEDYVDMIDEDALDLAGMYSERGGSPKACVALGLNESDNIGLTLEQIASELDISRKAVYNARDELGLVEMNARGSHIK